MAPSNRSRFDAKRRATDDSDRRRSLLPLRPEYDSRDRSRVDDRVCDRGRNRYRSRECDHVRERNSDRDVNKGWSRDQNSGPKSGRGHNKLDSGDRGRTPRGRSADNVSRTSGSRKHSSPVTVHSEAASRDTPNVEPRGPGQIVSTPLSTLSEQGDKDTPAQALHFLLQKNRELAKLELEKTALDRLLQRRALEARKSSARCYEFPSVLELQKRMTGPEQAQRERVEKEIQQTKDMLANLSEQLLSDILQKHEGPNRELVRAIQIRQEALEQDIKSSQSDFIKANKGLTDDSLELKKENAKLKEDVASSLARVATLTNAVTLLTSKVEATEAAGSRTTSEIERIDARAAEQATTMQSMHKKTEGYDRTFSEIDPKYLVQAADFFALEKAKMTKDVCEHTAQIADLRSEISSLRTQLPTTSSDIPNSAIVFPGDDFSSLRNDIGRLNEKMAQLELLPLEVQNLANQQITMAAASYINVDKLSRAQELMAERFDKLVDEAIAAQLQSKEHIAQLKTVMKQGHQSVGNGPAVGVLQAGLEATGTVMGQLPEPMPAPLPEPELGDASQTTALKGTGQPDSNVSATVVAGAPISGSVVNRLLTDVNELQSRMQATEAGMQTIVNEMDRQCDALRLMVSTLDTQYNNLTTKDLFDAIVGHMENLCPNVHQLQQDVENMSRRIRSIEQHSRHSDEVIRRLLETADTPAPGSAKKPIGDASLRGSPVEAGRKRRKRTGSLVLGTRRSREAT